MGETFYIFKDGDLSRKDNNIVVKTPEGDKKNLKSEIVDEIYVFGECNMNTKLLNFLSQKKITMHIFNYYGFYSGSFNPRESNISGALLVDQVKKYDDDSERLKIAKKILKAGSFNIYRNLRYYNARDIDLEDSMKEIKRLLMSFRDRKSTRQKLML